MFHVERPETSIYILTHVGCCSKGVQDRSEKGCIKSFYDVAFIFNSCAERVGRLEVCHEGAIIYFLDFCFFNFILMFAQSRAFLSVNNKKAFVIVCTFLHACHLIASLSHKRLCEITWGTLYNR